MLRNKTEILCDNCGADIQLPLYKHTITYFGRREGKSKRISATVCDRCADEFENTFVALFYEQVPMSLNRA